MFIIQESYYTGSEEEDTEVLEMIRQLLDILKFVSCFFVIELILATCLSVCLCANCSSVCLACKLNKCVFS